MTWETQIIVFAGLQGILLSIILFKHALSKNHANKYLAALVLIFSTNVLIDEACRNLSHQYPHFYGSTYPIQFLFGPILYAYIAALLGWIKKMRKQDWFHFVPFLVITALLLPFYVQSGNDKVQMVLGLVEGPIITLFLFKSIPAFHFFGYTLFTIVKGMNTQRISNTKTNLRLKSRIMVMVSVSGIIWLAVGALYLFRAFAPELPIKGYIYNITGVATSLFIYLIGYMGWLYPETYQQMSKATKVEDKYNKSGLSRSNSTQLFKKLVLVMEDKKPYLDSDLSMAELAKEMSVSSNHLSQIINENCGKSYFDFVNKYRVVHAKQMLEDPSNKKNTLQIAYAVGFNSKSAYYNAFRKNFNCTPAAIKRGEIPAITPEFAFQ